MSSRAAALLIGLVTLETVLVPPAAHSQGVDVFLDVTRGGAKYGIAIPEFVPITAGAEERSLSRALPEIMGNDLRFTAQFAPVVNEAPLPDDAAALTGRLTDPASRGAHAALRGSVAIAGPRLTVELRLYDLLRADFPRSCPGASGWSRSATTAGSLITSRTST